MEAEDGSDALEAVPHVRRYLTHLLLGLLPSHFSFSLRQLKHAFATRLRSVSVTLRRFSRRSPLASPYSCGDDDVAPLVSTIFLKD